MFHKPQTDRSSLFLCLSFDFVLFCSAYAYSHLLTIFGLNLSIKLGQNIDRSRLSDCAAVLKAQKLVLFNFDRRPILHFCFELLKKTRQYFSLMYL